MEGGDFIKSSTRYNIAALGVVILLVLLASRVLADKRRLAADTSTFETYSETTIISDCSSEPGTETEESQPTTETTSATNANATTTNSESGKHIVIYYTDNDAVDIAKVLYRECRGVPSVTEQACVAWTILNRVDNNNASIHDVVSSPHQFAFSENTPVDETLLNLAYDVLERWNSEKNGETNVGRVLPESYLWFEGHSGHNYFRNRYDGDFTVWSYSLESPYES
jgi:hypothetical protein